MKSLKYIAILAAVAIACSLGAFAKNSNSGSFDLSNTAKVGSTVLHPGHYKAEWTGSEQALQISILQNGKTVATAHGQLKQLPEKAPYTAVDMKTLNNKSQQVKEIDFTNRDKALMISGS